MAQLQFEVANKYFARTQALLDAGEENVQALDRLRAGLPNSDGLEKGLVNIAYAIDKIDDRLANSVPNGVAEGLVRIAYELDRIDDRLAALGRQDQDNVTALYAAAVDTSGDIVGRTEAGRWLNKCGYGSLKAIVDSGRRNRAGRRQHFVECLRRTSGEFPNGLAKVMTDDELGRFYDLAPSVWKAIVASQVEPRAAPAAEAAEQRGPGPEDINKA